MKHDNKAQNYAQSCHFLSVRVYVWVCACVCVNPSSIAAAAADVCDSSSNQQQGGLKTIRQTQPDSTRHSPDTQQNSIWRQGSQLLTDDWPWLQLAALSSSDSPALLLLSCVRRVGCLSAKCRNFVSILNALHTFGLFEYTLKLC